MTEADFRAMVEAHDLMYLFSDDMRVYRAGRDSMLKIQKAAEALPPGVAKRIWDATVDAKLVAPLRAEFYWIQEPA